SLQDPDEKLLSAPLRTVDFPCCAVVIFHPESVIATFHDEDREASVPVVFRVPADVLPFPVTYENSFRLAECRGMQALAAVLHVVDVNPAYILYSSRDPGKARDFPLPGTLNISRSHKLNGNGEPATSPPSSQGTPAPGQAQASPRFDSPAERWYSRRQPLFFLLEGTCTWKERSTSGPSSGERCSRKSLPMTGASGWTRRWLTCCCPPHCSPGGITASLTVS